MKIPFIVLISFITSNLIDLSSINESIKGLRSLYYQKVFQGDIQPNLEVETLINYFRAGIDLVMDILTNELESNSLKEIAKCQDKVHQELDIHKFGLLMKIIAGSGKGISEFGDEKKCLQEKMTYFILVYSLSMESGLEHEEDKEVIKFLNQSTFMTGICFVDECIELMKQITNTSSVAIIDFFHSLNIQSRTMILTDKRDKDDPRGKALNIIVYFIIGYFFFKVLLTVIKIIFLSSHNIQSDETIKTKEIESTKEKPIDKSMNQSNNNIDDDNSVEEKPHKNDRKSNRQSNYSEVIFQHHFPIGRIGPEIENKKSRYLNFINFFDFFDNLKALSEEKTEYYDDKNITIFSFFNCAIMFLITFNHNFTTLTRIPGREFLNDSFYISPLFFIVKFSSYASIFWFIIKAAAFGYKFMSSIKKELLKTNRSTISFVFILKWWCLVIPNIFLYLLIFFILHAYIDRFKYVFTLPTMFQFYLDIIEKGIQCKSDLWYIFVPYYSNSSENKDSRHFDHCYKFVYYSINQFYCFIAMTLFIYFAYKIRSKIVEIALFAFWVINVLLSYLFFLKRKSIENSLQKFPQFNLKDVLGQNITEMKTHLALNYYLIGLWLGFSVFYYFDAVSNNSLINSQKYVPFRYCYTVLRWFDTFKRVKKNVILSIFSLLCLIFSFSYTLISLAQRGSSNNLLLFEFTYFINVLDCYEKIIVGVCFCFIILLILLQPEDSAIKFLTESNLFLPFSRISTSFFYVIEACTYAVYCLFLIQLKLSYTNLIYFSIGLLLLVSIFCFLLTVMFELPLRILVKFLLRKCSSDRIVKDIKVISELSINGKLMNDEG